MARGFFPVSSLLRDDFPDKLATAVQDRCGCEVAGVDAEPGEEGGQAGPDRTGPAVLDLDRNANAVRRHGAKQRLRATLAHPAGMEPHQARVRRVWAADQIR